MGFLRCDEFYDNRNGDNIDPKYSINRDKMLNNTFKTWILQVENFALDCLLHLPNGQHAYQISDHSFSFCRKFCWITCLVNSVSKQLISKNKDCCHFIRIKILLGSQVGTQLIQLLRIYTCSMDCYDINHLRCLPC